MFFISTFLHQQERKKKNNNNHAYVWCDIFHWNKNIKVVASSPSLSQFHILRQEVNKFSVSPYQIPICMGPILSNIHLQINLHKISFQHELSEC